MIFLIILIFLILCSKISFPPNRQISESRKFSPKTVTNVKRYVDRKGEGIVSLERFINENGVKGIQYIEIEDKKNRKDLR